VRVKPEITPIKLPMLRGRYDAGLNARRLLLWLRPFPRRRGVVGHSSFVPCSLNAKLPFYFGKKSWDFINTPNEMRSSRSEVSMTTFNQGDKGKTTCFVTNPTETA
jgi:hypothetical protein